MRLHLFALLGLTLATYSNLVASSFVNRTIDDGFGDEVTGEKVTYSGHWAHASNNSFTEFQNGTFSQGASTPANGDVPALLSFGFTGVAVYVYGMLAGVTNISIAIDGAVAGTFHSPVQNPPVFNASLFAVDSLPYGQHNVSVQTVDPGASVVNFDYAVYTINTSALDTSSGSSSSSSHRFPIVTVIWGIAGTLLYFLSCSL